MKPGRYETSSPEETLQLGYTFGRTVLQAGDTVLFYGGMGVGKTTCIKGIVQAFGGNPNDVVSPTFVLVNIYRTHIPIYHIDLYRLNSFDEIFYAGILDLFDAPGIRLVEWAERLGNFHEGRCIHVTLSFANTTKRTFDWDFDLCSHA